MRIVFAVFLLTIFGSPVFSQSTAYVFKGGASIGLQKWDNSLDREPLFSYHGALAIESVSNDNDYSSLYAQIGYHIRGSAIRFRTYNINNPQILGNQFTTNFEFRNVALQLGAKQKFDWSPSTKYYYFGGIRGEYNISSNLGEVSNSISICNPGALPLQGGEQKFLFGFSVGGGIQFDFAELVGGQLEVSVHPDVTSQYRQGPIPNVIDQCGQGQTYTIPERRIRNTSIEISLGLRLIRKVVYTNY
ncbi:MAG: hypothetical protein R2792_05675 [Saprospiraceae bacterium]